MTFIVEVTEAGESKPMKRFFKDKAVAERFAFEQAKEGKAISLDETNEFGGQEILVQRNLRKTNIGRGKGEVGRLVTKDFGEFTTVREHMRNGRGVRRHVRRR